MMQTQIAPTSDIDNRLLQLREQRARLDAERERLLAQDEQLRNEMDGLLYQQQRSTRYGSELLNQPLFNDTMERLNTHLNSTYTPFNNSPTMRSTPPPTLSPSRLQGTPALRDYTGSPSPTLLSTPPLTPPPPAYGSQLPPPVPLNSAVQQWTETDGSTARRRLEGNSTIVEKWYQPSDGTRQVYEMHRESPNEDERVQTSTYSYSSPSYGGGEETTNTQTYTHSYCSSSDPNLIDRVHHEPNVPMDACIANIRQQMRDVERSINDSLHASRLALPPLSAGYLHSDPMYTAHSAILNAESAIRDSISRSHLAINDALRQMHY